MFSSMFNFEFFKVKILLFSKGGADTFTRLLKNFLKINLASNTYLEKFDIIVRVR